MSRFADEHLDLEQCGVAKISVPIITKQDAEILVFVDCTLTGFQHSIYLVSGPAYLLVNKIGPAAKPLLFAEKKGEFERWCSTQSRTGLSNLR